MASHFAEPQPNPEDKSRSRKRTIATVFAVLVASAIGYGAGYYYFSTHFVPGSMIDGIDASFMTVPELSEEVEDRVASYNAHVTGDGLDFELNADNVGLAVDGETWATKAFAEQDPIIWPLEVLCHPFVQGVPGITYDAEKLAATVSEVVTPFNEESEPPTNAYATYDPNQSSFVVVPSQLGTELNEQAVIDTISSQVLTFAPEITLGEDQLQRPAILDDDADLAQTIQTANEIINFTIPLTLDGETLVTVTPDLISQWVTVTEGDDGPSVSVDRGAIQSWSYKNLNDIVNGENETRTWEVDSYELSLQLAPRLAASNSESMEIPTITIEERPPESEGHESRGRHIDVNLSTQYARLYDTDGKTVLWRSYIVSGNTSDGHGTITGEFTIENHDRDIIMVGADEDHDGEPDYRTPCSYWMGFYLNSVGIHDAPWRSYFGGDIYTWYGSHGCVNVPYEKAEELWNLTDFGDKVYVHY